MKQSLLDGTKITTDDRMIQGILLAVGGIIIDYNTVRLKIS